MRNAQRHRAGNPKRNGRCSHGRGHRSSPLRERKYVFADRHDAGKQLAALIRSVPGVRCDRILAIPEGGVPVGSELARAFVSPLSLAVVRKIRIPGNTEAGFGAVTWDGRVRINESLVRAPGLSEDRIDAAIKETRRNVLARIARFTGSKPFPDIRDEDIIITDDGLASGFTMLAALESVRSAGPASVSVAVPTAPSSTIPLIAGLTDRFFVVNIRSGGRFAVADAYRQWYDLDDDEVLRELSAGRSSGPATPA